MRFYKNCVDIYYSIFGEDRKSRKSLYLVGFFEDSAEREYNRKTAQNLCEIVSISSKLVANNSKSIAKGHPVRDALSFCGNRFHDSENSLSAWDMRFF